MVSASSRILYVDDSQAICEMMRVVLTSTDASFQIVTVPSALDSLPLIEDGAIDLYILDYAMPEMTGIELCRKIREKDSFTPVIFFSGMSNNSYKQAALNAGANEYLTKPNDINQLTKIVKRLLASSKSKRKRAARI